MKTCFILSILVLTILSLPNDAPYIKAQGRPLNIAHRGLTSLLPQNTLQSFSAALYQGADFIELDVVYTKQKQLLVMHDPFLTRITNIRNMSQFSTRYSTRVYNGVSKTDWWTDEFTLNQLKTLGIKQDQAPGRISIFDYKFTFPTLEQVIKTVLAFNQKHKGKRNADGRLGGILIEAKDSQMYRDLYGLQIGETILQLLRKYKLDTIQNATNYCPIYLHSFDYTTVKYWSKNSELPRNYLITIYQDFNITDINLYATGIGFNDQLLWNYSNNTISSLFNQTRDLGLLIHIWTFKDDVILFNAKDNIEMYTIGQNLMQLDGVITEFCDIYAPISQMLRSNNPKTTKHNNPKPTKHNNLLTN